MTLYDLLKRVHEVANDPAVLPNIAPGLSRIDMSGYVLNAANVIFLHPDGVGLFIHLGGAFYEPHWLFTAALRGREAKRFTVQAISALFDKYPDATIIGHVPKAHKAARVMARAIGCTPSAESVDPYGRSCIVYKMERTRWVELWAASAQWSVPVCRPTPRATPQTSTQQQPTVPVNEP